MHDSPPISPDDDAPLAVAFRRWTAVAAIALLITTVRLWLPQTVYPRVPLIGAAVGWPDGVDLLAFGAMFGGLLLTFTPQRQGFGWCVFVAAFVTAVLADQHRLQPWAYQFALLAVVFAVANERRSMQLARWLAIAILFHSGHSKLDYEFLTRQGPALVDQLAGVVGLDPKWWSAGFRTSLAATMPVGELLIAVGLIVRRTRCAAAWAAIGMHVVLLIVLGPWGRDHAWGVLLWNVYFIGQTLVLFTPWRAEGVSPPVTSSPPVGVPTSDRVTGGLTPPARRSWLWIGELTIGAAIVLPLLEPFGLFDHWPAWSVYSPRSERVALFVPADARAELPASLAGFVREPDFEGWCRIETDRWSLATLGAPAYPQERFRIGVVRAIVEQLPDDVPIRVVIEGVPHRWSGERPNTVVGDRAALENRSETFRWNAAPKRLARQ